MHTAYHFDDATQMLHVMVPDKENPSFDGTVTLDHRTVHLIECVDGRTDALFNKIVRDSVIKVKWDVEWFEESEDGSGEPATWAADGTMGTWIPSCARYFIRMANQLLVEDKATEGGARGFVIITADLNLKLKVCQKNKGIEDFNRLINEGLVQSGPEALEAAQNAPSRSNSPEKQGGKIPQRSGNDMPANGNSGGARGVTSARRLADMSRGLRECVVDLLDDRDRVKNENEQLAYLFHQFSLSGDLDSGLKLMDHFEKVQRKIEKMKQRDDEEDDDENEDPDEKMEAIGEDAMYLAQKMERSLNKIVRAGAEVSTNAEEEIETLRRSLKKAKKELEEKEAQLQELQDMA